MPVGVKYPRDMAGPLQVDCDALEQLGGQLSGLQAKLEGLGHDIGAFDEAVGDEDVRSRLSALTGNWSKARQRIAGELKDLAALASGAAAEYRSKETEITSLASQPADPAQ
jgi:hypothetical protein